MSSEIKGWAVYAAILSAIGYTGWDEPLRYKMMSKPAIAEEEMPLLAPPPAPVSRQKVNRWQPVGTALDRAPYETRSGQVSYSDNYDKRELGTSTESAMQQYKERSAGGQKTAPAPVSRR